MELSAETLASSWNISISDAKETLRTTTQNPVVIRQCRIHRRVKTTSRHVRYLNLTGFLGLFSSDTVKTKVKPLCGNKYTQLFCSRGNFSKYYLTKKKSDAHHSLDSFIYDVDIPEEILTNSA